MSLFDWFADRRKGQFVGKVNQESDEGMGSGANVLSVARWST